MEELQLPKEVARFYEELEAIRMAFYKAMALPADRMAGVAPRREGETARRIG